MRFMTALSQLIVLLDNATVLKREIEVGGFFLAKSMGKIHGN